MDSPAEAAASSPAPLLGFTTLHDEVELEELPLTGELPQWLEGSLVRTGPARWEVGERRLRHWFDGLAMLHRFGISDGRVSYTNRYLQSRAYRHACEHGEIGYPEFATDPCRSIFQRVQTLFGGPEFGDNGNVNVARLGERHVAMTESPLPVEFDPATLQAAVVAPFRIPGQLSTAHPHLDRESGGMLNYAARLGPRSSYRFFCLAPGESEPRVIGSVPVREPAYMHSFGLTPRWLVLAEFPLLVRPLSLALSGRPYIENYRWRPERGTRFTLVDRRTGQARAGFRTDACFAFHHVNAYDSGGEVVVDMCAYPDAQIVEDLYLERLRGGTQLPRAELRRFRLQLEDGTVRGERLCAGDIELPRINYGRCNERAYRHVWGNCVGESGFLEGVVKMDTRTGASFHWSSPGCYAGEPVFVESPQAQDEDDGVVLSVVLDEGDGRSFLLVLDATDLREIARASLPHHVPFGFHGQFEPARG